MKYWNKQLQLRKKWHKIALPRDPLNRNTLFPDFDGWTRYDEFDKMKRTLQLLDSPGKFYMNIRHKDIYFERESDAVYFSLKYL